jgi:6-phosphogluconate dehydrogenase
MQIAILGLGAMGKVVAEKLMSEGHEVIVWNRAKDVLEQFRVDKAEFIVTQKLRIAHSIESLQELLTKPRIFCLLLATKEETEEVCQEILDLIEPGDIVIDASDSYYKDTDQRSKTFEAKGVKFLGLGLGGGLLGAENGFSVMAGGNKEGYDFVKSMLDSLAKPQGAHAYFGVNGAGHFVKMVHDAVGAVVMQAIAEGFGVLTKSEYQFNVNDIAAVWQGSGLPSGYLLSIVAKQLLNDPTIFQSQGVIQTDDAVRWVDQQGKEVHVPVDLMEKALDFRSRSQFDKLVQETVAAKLIASVEKVYRGKSPKKVEEKPLQNF